MIVSNASFRVLFPWVQGFIDRISRVEMPDLSGDTLCITSDYSGSDKQSRYDIYSFLVTSVADSSTWQTLRRGVRAQYLPDGRRLSFKNLNDKKRAAALPYFLEAASSLPGLCVTIGVSKAIPNLCHGDLLLGADSPLVLRHTWNVTAFEKMARVTHFIALLVAQFSKPGQNVYWVSDEDELFGGDARAADLIKLLGLWSGMHSPHPLGELGAGTTAIDPGDRTEEDLAAIPDLVAGATREYLNALSVDAGGRVRIGLVMELRRAFTPKTEIILTWMAQPSRLSHLALIFDQGPTGGFFLSRLDFA